jgi:GNAT superfamily N-acetyltransferase
MQITLIRTDPENINFIKLVKELDDFLTIIDGSEHSYYAQFNKLDSIKHVIIAILDNKAIGCGAIKEFDTTTMEIKRMYVLPQYRGKRIAEAILKDLEKWALELSYSHCILETSDKLEAAIALYKKCNYQTIENYGQYVGLKNSVCFIKKLMH